MRLFKPRTIPGWFILAFWFCWEFLGAWARIEFFFKKAWPEKPMIPILTAIAQSRWFSLVILFAGLAWIWWTTRSKLQQSIESDINIRIIGNVAKEPDLEWIHLEVEPSVSLKVAKGARVKMKVVIDDRQKLKIEPAVYSMRWSSDEGPKEERTLRYGQPGRIPLILRSSINRGVSGYGRAPHTPVQRNICYITDDQFLIHQNPIHQVPVGRHKLTIFVFYGEHPEPVSKVFELGVSHPLAGPYPITLISEEEKLL